ncbi:hypothetical protein [Tunicatimonas pelagia]|uniref:hypothetical protein n=1 Tax=Tunicatimonas pelagia TaxID=931531 RepID=UPI002666D213|nr:hypothetical protein [Tunicatimonas pelagia]WKN46507.1 hypothetical protein P0M28_30620 [Tunicatimonas pelagia]
MDTTFFLQNFAWSGSIEPHQLDRLSALRESLLADGRIGRLAATEDYRLEPTNADLDLLRSAQQRLFFRFPSLNFKQSLLLVKTVRNYNIEVTCEDAIPEEFKRNLKVAQGFFH